MIFFQKLCHCLHFRSRSINCSRHYVAINHFFEWQFKSQIIIIIDLNWKHFFILLFQTQVHQLMIKETFSLRMQLQSNNSYQIRRIYFIYHYAILVDIVETESRIFFFFIQSIKATIFFCHYVILNLKSVGNCLVLDSVRIPAKSLSISERKCRDNWYASIDDAQWLWDFYCRQRFAFFGRTRLTLCMLTFAERLAIDSRTFHEMLCSTNDRENLEPFGSRLEFSIHVLHIQHLWTWQKNCTQHHLVFRQTCFGFAIYELGLHKLNA